MTGPIEPPEASGADAPMEPSNDEAAVGTDAAETDAAETDTPAAETALPAGGPPAAGTRLPPGASIFTIEGRAAPGLYFVGWIASLMGLGILLVGLLAGGGMSAVALTLVGSALLSVGLVSAAGAQAIERRARAAAYAGPSPFLAFAATLPLTILLVVLVVAPASALGLDSSSPLAALISIGVTALVYVGLVRLLVVGPGALSWAEMGVRRFGAVALSDLATGAAFALPVILLTSLVAAVLVQLVGTTPDSPLPPSTSGAGFVLNLVSAALIAPVGEELFYRGFATTAWARGMGTGRALIRGALFFALIHVLTIGGSSFGDAAGRALVAFIARIPVSFALGWLFLRRRSVYASIGLHATFNGVLVILAELAVRSAG